MSKYFDYFKMLVLYPVASAFVGALIGAIAGKSLVLMGLVGNGMWVFTAIVFSVFGLLVVLFNSIRLLF